MGGSILLHVLLGVLVLGLAVRARPAPQQALQIAVVDVPPPPPPEPPPSKPIPLKPPPRVARVSRTPPTPVPVKAPLPAPVAAPPPPTVEAKKAEPAPVVVTGITMESTSQGGSFAVGAGNTLQGAPEKVAREPGTVKAYKAESYAPVSQVTELPRPLNTGPVNLRKYYPPPALKAGFEGDVVLRLLIEVDGAIGKVEIVSDPGQGLGPAAARMVRAEYRFSPAKLNGTPVATTVPFTVHFTLN